MHGDEYASSSTATERRRGYKGGPTGHLPSDGPPARGGRGYSEDDEERRLEWAMDRIMQRRISEDVPLVYVMEHVERLQAYRDEQGITGRLDERVGRRLSSDERDIVELLLKEDRNVTSLAVKDTGEPTPDIAVDALTVEIKSSTSGNARAFAGRVQKVWPEQGTPRILVDATFSWIDRSELLIAMQGVVRDRRATYIRVIGGDYDEEIGTWG